MRLSLKSFEPQIRRWLLLTVFFSIPAWLAFTKVSVLDPDIWWHLRTGQWVIEHHSVPYQDWFSSYGMGKPWAAYSWLFEILIYQLFSRFELIGLALYVYALLLAITTAFFMLVRRFEQRLAHSIVISAGGVCALTHMATPRPWLFTILFFAIELHILISVRRSRKYRYLFYLVPLFVLWANLHIQFVYGLFALGLATLEEPIDRLLRREITREISDHPLPLKEMMVVIAACALATLLNPYHWHIYQVTLDTARQGGLYGLISELSALEFRTLPEWLVMLLALAAVFNLGKYSKLGTFWYMLLAAAIFLSFRSKRDVWFLITVAITIIPLTRAAIGKSIADRIGKAQIIAVAVSNAAVLSLILALSGISNLHLANAVAAQYPVAAANFADQHQLARPLYNHFDWGGYLIWRLPNLPVSIDGRSNIHDEARIKNSAKVWNGEPNWHLDSELANARTVILKRTLPLAQLLRVDSRFRAVYEDNLSVIFVSNSR